MVKKCPACGAAVRMYVRCWEKKVPRYSLHGDPRCRTSNQPAKDRRKSLVKKAADSPNGGQ